MVVEPVASLLDDRYELGPVIGRGAMGEVHKGWDRRLERQVAIKCLRRDFAADEGVRRRFEEEARAAGGLAHHNIVTVYDTGECDGVPYIVMECLPGRTLEDEIAEGPVAAGDIAAMGAELAGALAAAHAAGVLHRDVKPANVLLDEHGSVKLADFGIAKSAESSSRITGTGTVIGSPAYLAPERLAGEPASASTDVYALGVLLYEAATGERPFHGDTPMAVALDVQTRIPTPMAQAQPALPEAVASAIDKAMAREPDGRPASAAELAALLRAAAPAAHPGSAPVADPEGGTQVMPVDVTSTTAFAPVPSPAPAAAAPTADLDEAPVEVLPGPVAHAEQAPVRRRRTRLLVASVAAVVILLVLLLVSREGPSAEVEVPAAGTEATTTAPPDGPSLPEPIDDALTDLEESIDP